MGWWWIAAILGPSIVLVAARLWATTGKPDEDTAQKELHLFDG
jgi:hypothetical protein